MVMKRPRFRTQAVRSPEAASLPVHEAFMRQALNEARGALDLGEVPVGAVLVREGKVVAQGFNQPVHSRDPTAHAEVVVLRKAAKELENYRLSGATLYVTIEPCLMCVGALVHARVSRLVYGADEPKAGAVRSILNLQRLSLNHRFEVVQGVLEPECRSLLVDFFKARRQQG